MATVFLAEDLKHHRQVAIKVLDPEIAQAIGPERFLREIETVARLTHPHILPLHDSGVADGLLFYVMPFVEGESLRDRLAREKQLPLNDALRIAREVADALSYAHAHGLVHRDIKPENVLLESGHAVVADFGIARAVAAAGTEKLTATGIAVGTPAYMSPEQAAGSRDPDGRSDLYSLGCVLYEMLAGVPPFAGTTAESLAHQHLNVTPRPVTELRPAVPATVAAALQRALAKVPADRFNPVAQFAEALGGAPSAVPTALPPADAKRRRVPWPTLATAAVVTILAAVAAWQQWWPFAGEPAARPTKREWILVAEFEGPPGEAELARAVQGLASTALDQSGVVMAVPRDQLKIALQNASRPDTLHVDGPLARELAYRGGIHSVLEGRVSRLGAGYSVVLRLSDAANDSTLITVNGDARDANALIRTVDHLTRKLRRDLRENPAAVRATRSLSVITPSFEAYKKFEQAATYWNETADGTVSGRLNREALALDPDFADAYEGLAFAYSGLGKPDSAVWACDEALRRRQRLTDEHRLYLEAYRATLRADFDGALQGLDRQLQLYPTGPYAGQACNVLSVINTWRGQAALAAEYGQKCIEFAPFGASQIAMNLQCGYEIQAGRFDRAERWLGQLRRPWRLSAAVSLAIARNDWARAESLCARPPGDTEANPALTAAVRCARQARRGEVANAREAIAQEIALRGPNGPWLSPRSLVSLASISGTLVPNPTPILAHDTTTRSIITRGWRDAAAGDLTAARRELAALRRKSPDDLARSGAAAQFIEATIAASEGRWKDVVRSIGPTALRGDDGATFRWGRVGAAPERWLVAVAHEHVGPPDSAAVAFERLLDSPQGRGLSLFPPYAHQRLVMIYARMGRREDAERHWEAFSREFTHPDPEVRHLLDEARSAIETLRAMSPRKG
jgi:tetratricopeptide (TPR) repeat protein